MPYYALTFLWEEATESRFLDTEIWMDKQNIGRLALFARPKIRLCCIMV